MVFICSASLVVADYYNFRSGVELTLKEQNMRAKNGFLELFVHTKYIAESISRQILVKHTGQKSLDYNFVNSLLIGYRNSVNELVSWSTFSWADKDFNLVVSSNVGIMDTPISMTHRDYMPLTLSYPHHIHLGKPVFGVVSKLWSIPAGYGVMDQRGNYLGSIITGMVLDGVEKRLDEEITDHSVVFAIVDLQGNILVKSLNFNLKESKKFFTKLKSNLLAKSFQYKNGYYQRVDDYPYGIVTFYRYGAFHERELLRLSVYIFLISILAFAIHLIFAFFYKKLLLPMFQLSEMAIKVLHGEKLENKVPKFEIEEVENFAKAIRSASQKRK